MNLNSCSHMKKKHVTQGDSSAQGLIRPTIKHNQICLVTEENILWYEQLLEKTRRPGWYEQNVGKN
jgi:hypothetical protein